MKRRVVKIEFRRYRVELPGGEAHIFAYADKPRPFDPDLEQFIDFKPGEDRYDLLWDGIHLESFPTDVSILLFIIRFAYDQDKKFLIPSEVLADFNLIYEGGDWVDEWRCPDWNEVIPALGVIERPPKRKLRFENQLVTVDELDAFERRGWEEDNDSGRLAAMLVRHASTNRGYENWRRPRRPPRRVAIPKLDFEALESPRQRRQRIPWDWEDPFDRGFAQWNFQRALRQSNRDILSDEECLFVLRSGDEAPAPEGPKRPRRRRKGKKSEKRAKST